MNSKNHNYITTAIAVYVSFLLCGVDMSITSQYKLQLAQAWGQGNNISAVLTVNSAVGIGGTVASFFTGFISDHFSRKLCAFMSSFLWAIFAFGMLYAPNAEVAYLIGIIGGIANSFTSAAWIPSMMDAYPSKRSLLTLLTKFFISLGQFILPFLIVILSALHLSFSVTFNCLGTIYGSIALVSLVLPFPKTKNEQQNNEKKNKILKGKLKVTSESLALALIGFSSTAVFMIWTQTNQELGKLYGLTDPALLQSIYTVTSLISVLVTSWLVNKGVRESSILIVYPIISAIALLFAYFIHSGQFLFVVAALIGWFAAGGLMQLATSLLSNLYSSYKATATSPIVNNVYTH